MDTATITLRLGGHAGNTIQKINVTPGEIAVLQLVHGDESVNDVEYTGEVQRSSRAEIERLHQFYGSKQNDGRMVSKAVAQLFPGAAARVFEKLSELELNETYIKNLGPSAEVKPEATPVALDKLNKTQLLHLASERNIDVSADDKKADIIAAIERAPVVEPSLDEDEEMPDASLFQ